MALGEGEKTEKITINLGLVDLGQIDLLVQEGFYTNRTDFIRTAIRTQLATRGEALDQTAARRTLTLGSCHYTRRDLEEIRDAGQMIQIRVLGLASIAADVSPQLALATIASVEVLGAGQIPSALPRTPGRAAPDERRLPGHPDEQHLPRDSRQQMPHRDAVPPEALSRQGEAGKGQAMGRDRPAG
jgi:Arc/MetJ-type ribon-helix-helix transcriptional regulator